MFNNKNIYFYIIFLLIGGVLGFFYSYICLANEDDISNGDKTLINFSYNQAIARASPAVVNIYSEQVVGKETQRKTRRFNPIFDNKSNSIKTSLGSGVILSSDGYILTNQHVIGDISLKITVELLDGKKYKAHLIGIDRGTDLAVLKISNSEAIFPSIEIDNSDKVKIGDIVLAIGNPYGLGQSVSMGIISATGREFENPYSSYIQTDASINKGNSGGALIDTQGRLIGINTLIRSSSGGSEGIGLAIPSTNALEIISDLIQYGEVRRGWLGFSIDKQSLITLGKLVISAVVTNGPAEIGGLQKNDILISINDSEPSYDNLYKTFARSKPGDVIKLEIQRKEEFLELVFTAKMKS
ncbi:trypsin-like peptidase domain-containing protein [Gammaproteobacteria bacterium]|nr:trypsin-like peptidase domain-containing protein [Gammaproteobacteria bacterium]MDC0508745.1 trypsin-like peptidase domain-containing protein [Gammaproteobacteria bacterium]MDC0546245.1 trypsin-like peptidase domain-containing protein [Gammaproteobacteria bacterium]MDC0577962.1 trypsin-like peptidase domain-containing protein [Gammaproteobacteria bacterium]|tara:strand:+ start:40 stop:1104 length:1065 start_codon:yes stop_codon:yes gene_type:complete